MVELPRAQFERDKARREVAAVARGSVRRYVPRRPSLVDRFSLVVMKLIARAASR